jgi:hypothetical protein
MTKLKTLVAALAMASTGGAFAAVMDPSETSTGGEMLLSIWSETAKVSYAVDMNLLYSSFATQALAKTAPSPTPYTFTWTLSSGTDAAMNSFLTALGANTDARFSFIGGDNSGVPANSRSMATTIKAGGDVTIVKSGNLVDGMNSIQANYVDNTSGGINTKMPSGMANGGSAFFTIADGPGYYPFFNQQTLNGKFNIGNDNALGTSADVYHFVRSTTNTASDAIETKLGTATLARSTSNPADLVFTFTTPVPEPESYALAFAGLAVVGLIARRRRAA